MQTAVSAVSAVPTPKATPEAGSSYIYPMPVRAGRARLALALAEPAKVELRIHNEAGALALMVTEDLPAGLQGLPLDLRGLAPGVYLYRLNLTYASGSAEKQPMKKFVVLP